MNCAFSKIAILIIFLAIVAGGIFAWQYLGQKTEIETPKAETPKEEIRTEPNLVQNSEKYKNEIQDLLNKQCQALSSKNSGLLFNTIDQSNADAFKDYKQSVEILLSMTNSVIKCQYEIKDIQVGKNAENLIAQTTEKGDLKIQLIDGSTKVIENPNISHAGKYIKTGEEWKQIIQSKN